VQSAVLASGGGIPTDNATKLKEQIEQEKAMQAELDRAEGKVNLLVKEKERLEAEIEEVAESMADPENHEQIEELEQHEEALKGELELINSHIERELAEVEQVKSAHDHMLAEIAEFQTRLQELKNVNQRLEHDNDQTAQATASHRGNLDEIRNQIELEAAQRNALESYIKQLKAEVMQLYNPEEADNIMEQDELKVAVLTF
jgi:chromosome segregation ATPase